jgi:hypothetical protein
MAAGESLGPYSAIDARIKLHRRDAPRRAARKKP